MLLAEHSQGKVNWVSKIQRILTENGFGIVWLCQGVGYEMRFVAESYRAINRTGTLKLKAVKNINGFLHSKLHLSLKTTSLLLRQKDFVTL